MNRESIMKFIKEDEACKGIKITNIDAVLDQLVHLFDIWGPYDHYDENHMLRFYVMGYAAGVQSRV